MKNLLNIITIILCAWLSWGRTDGAQKRESGEVSFHRIQASSLFPSSSASCVLSPRASNTKSSLHVVHRHGPCSSLSSKKARRGPDHDEILRLDQARVKSIHSKLSKKSTAQEYRVSRIQSTDLEARDGSTLGSGNYIVTVGIGTPKHDLSLEFDTGSDLTWTQCQPCIGKCYPQKEPIFNPSSSTSYSNISCTSPVCDSLTSQGHLQRGDGDKSLAESLRVCFLLLIWTCRWHRTLTEAVRVVPFTAAPFHSDPDWWRPALCVAWFGTYLPQEKLVIRSHVVVIRSIAMYVNEIKRSVASSTKHSAIRFVDLKRRRYT